MRTRTATIIIAAALGLSLQGCIKQSLETAFVSQEGKIDTYVTSQLSKDETYTVSYNGGSTRLTLVQGTGDELSPTGIVSFYYAGYIFSGGAPSASNLFATNHEATASAARWELSGEGNLDVLTVDLSEKSLIEGLQNGLAGVKAGEECMILFSGKHGFGRKAPGTIPANSALVYHVWVSSISNE